MKTRFVSWSFAIAISLALKEGDLWQFNISRKGGITSSTELNDGLYELTFTQGKIKLYQVSGSQKTEMPVQPDGPTQVLLNLVGKSDQRPVLKFPISVGQKWTYQYETRPTGQTRDQKRNVEVNVTGMEQVTTPGGPFKAYKLVRNESWTTGPRGGQGGSNITYFFSPETKSVVKSSSESLGSGGSVETELMKFTPGN